MDIRKFLKTAEALHASPLWVEQMRLRFNFADGDLEKKLDEFFLDCRCLEKRHLDTGDAKQHFFNWLNKKLQIQNEPNNANNNDNRRRPRKAVTAGQGDYKTSF